MTRGESETHGAEGAGGPWTPPASGPARGAAARYLDAWERNQAEVARSGPPSVAPFAAAG